MALTAKKSYHHGDLRQCLIDAAIELIREGDIRDLSLRQAAKRVGVSHKRAKTHLPNSFNSVVGS
jgi:AcrR family transcriptional regulator